MSDSRFPLSDGCPVCGGTRPRRILDCDGIPLRCNSVFATRDEALSVERGHLRLVHCDGCSMIYNAAFEPGRISYSQDYENAQHFSPRFDRYLRRLAESLVDRHRLRDKNVVEIGCGDAYFLSLICAAGGNRGFGFDPAAPDHPHSDGDVEVTLIREVFTGTDRIRPVDFLCCRHMLEHLPEPGKLLDVVKRVLQPGSAGGVYFEVPNALVTIKQHGIWDILYEHCLYFTASSLAALFARSGFELLRIEPAFDEQFLCVEARPAQRLRKRGRYGGDGRHHDDRGAVSDDAINGFERHYKNEVRDWSQRLGALLDQNRRIAVWGAGTKGVMFLNTVSQASRIHAAVDVNPRKRGGYVAGTGQRIISPRELKQLDPDAVIVMNPAYEVEIRKEIARLEIECEMLAV